MRSSEPVDRGGQTASELRIELSVGDTRLTATLLDTAAGRDLVEQLPMTLTMSDHGSVEMAGRLPAPLSTDGSPAGADPGVGDLGYYAPWNDLNLYYGDQTYHEGIVILGTLHGDLERVARMSGDISVTIEAIR